MTDARDVIAGALADEPLYSRLFADAALAALREAAGTPCIAIDEQGQLWALHTAAPSSAFGSTWRLVAPHPHQP